MTQTIFGTKQRMVEAYLGQSRVPVTRIDLSPMTVTQLKTAEKDGYVSAQVAFGQGKKHISKAYQGHLKKSSVKNGKLREIIVADTSLVGDVIAPSDVVSAGSIVTVTGTAKGKGFAGVMKRWNFAGGPRTHGQSDRARAPGSVGQGTTPGRVHKGKKMAGRMGGQSVTVKNAVCIAVSGNSIWVTGPVPGSFKSLIKIVVTGSKEIADLGFLKGYKPEEIVVAVESAEPVIESAETVDVNEASTPAVNSEPASADTETKVETK